MKRTGPILMVDDDKDICELLTLVLEGEGYRVTVASDGVAAWEQLTTGQRPSLIILDWMMPRMDGEQFLKRLSTSNFAHVPVIVMSGNDTVQHQMSNQTRAYCLKKPVELDELLSTVRHFISRSPRTEAA